jgi:two-component sensor histidine kinase
LSLSATHDLLVSGAWGDVLLSDAMLSAIRPLIDIDRVSISGPSIKLSPNVAVTLNMVFHELSTNAIKYGAASVDTGKVMITWRVEDKVIKLLWKEIGGPEIKNPDGMGFGSKLLDRAIRREMKGKSAIEFMREGIECYMEIPLSKMIRE